MGQVVLRLAGVTSLGDKPGLFAGEASAVLRLGPIGRTDSNGDELRLERPPGTVSPRDTAPRVFPC